MVLNLGGRLPDLALIRPDSPKNNAVLFVKCRPASVALFFERMFYKPGVLPEAFEFLDQFLSAQVINIFAIPRLTHLAHQGRTFMMEGNGDGRLIEKERQKYVVKPGRDHKVRSGDL